MSEMELHTGKIRKIDNIPVDLRGEELVSWLKKQGYRIDDYEIYQGRKDDIILDGGNVVQLDSGYYHLIEHREHDPFGDTYGMKTDDGCIAFLCYWYNGGAGFEEVLDEVVRKIDDG